MRVIGVIPIRLGSKRFPGKALALLQGKPMIQHVYENALKSLILDELVIATDDKQIYNSAVGFGAPVVITPREYSCGTDRVAHAVNSLDCEIVVNIQGDQPFLVPQIIDNVVEKLLCQPDLVAATPIYPITNVEDIANTNTVKVVIDGQGYALYFSRLPIPYIRNKVDNGQLTAANTPGMSRDTTSAVLVSTHVGTSVDPEDRTLTYKHIGIYAYRKDFIAKYAKLSPSRLEIAEGLEQLRILENGYRIMTVQTIYDSPSVDSEEDLQRLMPRA